MTGNAVTTGIITGGLSCDPTGTACQNGIITTFFDLYCTEYVPPVKVPVGGGGHYPRDAWNKFNPGDIQNFYKEISDKQQYYVVPREQEDRYFRRHKVIKLRIKVGDHQIEKEYSVPEKRAKQAIKVLNVVDATLSSMKVVVANVKKLTTEAVVTVKNFKLKKKRS